MRTAGTLAALAGAAVLAACGGAEAASDVRPPAHQGPCQRFAAPTGHDAGRGTERRPFRTAQRLVDSLRPGETGCLRGGVYAAEPGEFVVRFERAGRVDARIRLVSYPGERATLVGGVEIGNGADHVTLSRLAIRGTGGQNTVKVYARGTIVQDSDITNRWRGKSCMIIGSDSYGPAVGTIVRRNRFHECGSPDRANYDHAIYAQRVVAARIVYNLFWHSAAYAVQLFPGAESVLFAHNVVDGGAPSVRGGVVFGGDSHETSSGNVVERNVIAYARTANITSNWDDAVGDGNVARFNCLWGGRTGNVDASDGGFSAFGNIVADPHFVDRGRHDYRLRPASRCLRLVGEDTAALLRRR